MAVHTVGCGGRAASLLARTDTVTESLSHVHLLVDERRRAVMAQAGTDGARPLPTSDKPPSALRLTFT